MTGLICPVCSLPLEGDKVLRCDKGHSFDVSRDGYVNLFLNKRADETGDDKEMSLSRYEFLKRGGYAPLAQRLGEISEGLCNSLEGERFVLTDAGCGSGYYDDIIYGHMKNKCRKDIFLYGFDLSKHSLKKAGRLSARYPNASFALANIFVLPLPDESTDQVLSVFAPVADKEFKRILKDKGVLTVVSPAEDHLFSLKSVLYENPYKNPCEIKEYEGFELISRERLTFTADLDGDTAKALFKMTPYTYKTSAEDMKKLDGITSLTTEADFYITQYIKRP